MTTEYESIVINNKFNGEELLSIKLRSNENEPYSEKLGRAVKLADTYDGELVSADLRGIHLSRANMQDIDLSYVDLSKAFLFSSDMSYANLSEANLTKSHAVGCIFYGTNMMGSILKEAHFTNVNFSDSFLNEADLRDANLVGANLTGVDLCNANLTGADLSGANMTKANLRGAKLAGVKLENTIGNGEQIKSMRFDRYDVVYTSNRLQIGHENHSISEWKKFDEKNKGFQPTYGWDWVMDMSDWWFSWRTVILGIIEKSPAVPTNG